MILECFTLFFAAVLGGLSVTVQRVIHTKRLRFLLVFSGGYLLANTLLHLMPDLFVSHVKPLHVGAYIMIGFFLQRFIENFSDGVEHGHSMSSISSASCVKKYKAFSFISSIAFHALLDGTILVHDHTHCHAHDHATESVLLGMVLHKFLEAFAFMSVLQTLTDSFIRSILYLTIFALASPMGLLLNNYMNHYMASGSGIILLAIVTGNFLYISATMFFEASPNHHSNQATLWISLLGAGLATLVEFVL